MPKLHFLRFYDAADPGRPDRIDPKDWGIPSLLNAAVPSGALQQIDEHYLSAVEEALACVKRGWTLEEEDPDHARREAVRALLLAAVKPNGVGSAVATKLLHKKRPNLIPVVDSVVRGFYGVRLPADLIFGPFRSDLIANRGILDRLARDASAVAAREVGAVRILELSMWLTSDAAKGYRVTLN